MAAEFNEIKAISEEIEALSQVEKAVSIQVRAAEQKAAEAEVNMNVMLKIHGFVRIELERKRTVRQELLDKQARAQ